MPNRDNVNDTARNESDKTTRIGQPYDGTREIRRPNEKVEHTQAITGNPLGGDQTAEGFSFGDIDWGDNKRELEKVLGVLNGSEATDDDLTQAMIDPHEGTTYILRPQNGSQAATDAVKQDDDGDETGGKETKLPVQQTDTVDFEPQKNRGKAGRIGKPLALGAFVIAAIAAFVVFAMPTIQEYLESQIDVPYSVSYVDINTGKALADSVTTTAKNHESVTIAPADIDGYQLSTRTLTLGDATVSEDNEDGPLEITLEAENSQNATFSYAKIVSYSVQYLDQGEKSIADAKTVKEQLSGSTVRETAPTVDGYTLSGESEQSLKLSNSKKKNVITFTYSKIPDPEPAYVAPTYSYTPTTSGGSSGKKSSGGSGLSNWGGSK